MELIIIWINIFHTQHTNPIFSKHAPQYHKFIISQQQSPLDNEANNTSYNTKIYEGKNELLANYDQ